MRRLTEAITQIKEICQKYGLTSTQFRYVCAEVRKALHLQVPKVPNKLPEFLTPAEIYHLLDTCKDTPFNSLLIEWQIFTGLRISETQKMQLEYIDFKNNTLKVVQGKGHKDRFVPITNNLLSKIKLFIGERKKGYLFEKTNGTPLRVRQLQNRINKEIKKAQFNKHVTVHGLRHTFACLCLSRGLSLDQTRDLMGHSSVKVTEIYAKITLQDLKAEFLRLM